MISCCANTTFIIDESGTLQASGENRFGQIDDTLKEYASFQKLDKCKYISTNNTSICKIDFEDTLTVQGRISAKIPDVKSAIVSDNVIYIDLNDTMHYTFNDTEQIVEKVKDVVADKDYLYFTDFENNVSRISKLTNEIIDLRYKAKSLFYGYDNFAWIDEEDFAIISSEKTIKAKKIQFGYDFTVVLDLENNVYFKGNNNYNQIEDFKSCDKLTKTNIKAKDIACGTYHIAYITEDDKLVTQGYNFNGQLGKPYTAFKNITDISVFDLESFNENVLEKEIINIPESEISRVEEELMVHKNISEILEEPKPLKVHECNLDEINEKLDTLLNQLKPKETKIKISHGNNFSAMIDTENNLYFKGINSYNQFCSDEKKFDTFTKVDIKAKDVACGFGHILIIDLDDNLIVSGMNYYGQLGLGHNEKVNEFTNTGLKADEVFASNWGSTIVRDKLIYESGLFDSEDSKNYTFKITKIK